MSDELEKINEIFRNHDELSATAGEEQPQAAEESEARKNVRGMDRLLIDASGEAAANYTGDAESERDYRPVRQSHEYRSGCLGGLMYFTFIVCVSIVLACLAWMAASDMLALNKDDFTAVVTLPSSVFQSETVDRFDENGRRVGTQRVTRADMDYVADVLKDAGLIEYKWLFTLFCRISHAESKVSPGEYELRSTFDYRALIQNMRAGSNSTITVMVTIPEGFKMHQIFLRLEENGVCSYNDLMEAAESREYHYDFLDESQGEGAYRLEGFLFPDTYEFYVGMQASSAINKLLEIYHRRITEEMYARAEELGMTMYDVLIVASLIEKEAANDAERPEIASVIYNRLNSGMVLGIDAAVLYPYNDHEGAPTAAMLNSNDPYNTRIHLGLTPTPICNPGLASINAALWPDLTDFYYYALDTETGTHRFFTNESEFDAFVATQDYS